MAAFLENIAPFRGNGNKNEKGQGLEEFLEEYDPYKYKNPCVTTDAVVFSWSDKGEESKGPNLDSVWKVLMIRRGNHPCIGWWALPGGFINLRENLRDTAKRELMEETGVDDLPMEQIAVYGNANRDPRARVITSAYMSVVEETKVMRMRLCGARFTVKAAPGKLQKTEAGKEAIFLDWRIRHMNWNLRLWWKRI